MNRQTRVRRVRARTCRRGDYERFLFGDCHVLARAVHRLTGWQIGAFFRGDVPRLHAFVWVPDGRVLDWQGLAAPDRFEASWRAFAERRGTRVDVIRPTTWEALRRAWGAPCFGKYSYERARLIAPRLVALVPASVVPRPDEEESRDGD